MKYKPFLIALADIFFPQSCLVCGGIAGPCCSACYAKIDMNQGLIGSDCGAATIYENPAPKKLIHQLKFNFMKNAAEPLGTLLARYFLSLGETAAAYADAAVIPIPLSRKRERHRGFNQASLIARWFVRVANASSQSSAYLTHLKHLTLLDDALIRVRNTKPQSETASIAERKENIRGCFAVNVKSLHIPAPQSVILVDDVMTTGSTLREAADALRIAGTKNILLLAVAYAEKNITAAEASA